MPHDTKRARPRARTPEARLRSDAQKLGKLALETLKKIMHGEGQDAVRLAAAREVLDRGHGRPKLGAPEDGSEGLTVVVRNLTGANDDPELDA